VIAAASGPCRTGRRRRRDTALHGQSAPGAAVSDTKFWRPGMVSNKITAEVNLIMKLAALYINGFKSFGNDVGQLIPFVDINVLNGGNAVGKSNILSCLNLLYCQQFCSNLKTQCLHYLFLMSQKSAYTP
jgi:hypothetical protein